MLELIIAYYNNS